MMVFSPKDIMKIKTDIHIHYNTGTFFDVMTGAFILGHDGKWYINGGLGNFYYLIFGLTSRYKTTIANSLMVNVLGRYEHGSAYIQDIEETNQDRERFDRMNIHNPYPLDGRLEISEKIHVSDVMDQVIAITEHREKNKKDLMIETPFINIKGERQKTWLPFIMILDSMSQLESNNREFFKKHKLEDSKTRMYWTGEGGKKTILTNIIKSALSDGGICFISIAHLGDDANYDSIVPKQKELPFGKQNTKIKGVGSRSGFAAPVAIETRNSKVHLMEKDDPYYKTDIPKIQDVNLVTTIVHKCKNNSAGGTFDFIVSQLNGMYSDLTNVEFLKEGKIPYGLLGTNKYAPCLLPDKKYSRNDIYFGLRESYELRRAFDLIAQMKFIQTTFPRNLLNFDIESFDVLKGAENLLKNDKTFVQDVLNSRGWWSYKDEERPYMSVLEVMEVLAKNM